MSVSPMYAARASTTTDKSTNKHYAHCILSNELAAQHESGDGQNQKHRG